MTTNTAMTRLLIVRNVHTDFISVADSVSKVQNELSQHGFSLVSSFKEFEIYENSENDDNGRHSLVFISTGDRVIHVTHTTT
ncbi:MAG TPA: hypothetical protein VEA37_08660 [Flavobacterium sp.]|nr:hypothetical protein [Flavobacterium sp.]